MSGSTLALTTIDPAVSGNVTNASLNDNGELVGGYTDSAGVQHGFIDSAGLVSSFNVSGAADTDITAVSNGGQIVGYSFATGLNGTSNASGFVGTTGSTTAIVISGVDVEPTATNGFGDIVGTAGSASFIDANGTVSLISATGAISTTAISVNAMGTVVGNYVDSAGVQHGFTDLNGTITTIDPAGSIDTVVTGVNASGELVGAYVDSSDNTFGFTDLNGSFTVISAGSATQATAINNAGTVVGFESGSDNAIHGFIDVNGAITQFDPTASVNTEPTGINNAGLVVGVFEDANGVEHAFTASITPACYCPGTLITTAHGDVAIETLAIGDRVLTVMGAAKPIRWIGRRSYSGRFLQSSLALFPVRVRAGALGHGLPTKDLLVSQAHALYLDGVLVPAGALVNGTTITREQAMSRVDYLHIELADHNIIYANGAAAETFVDDESRGMFQNAADFAARYPDAPQTQAVYCAPRIVDGFALAALRDSLAGQRAA